MRVYSPGVVGCAFCDGTTGGVGASAKPGHAASKVASSARCWAKGFSGDAGSTDATRGTIGESGGTEDVGGLPGGGTASFPRDIGRSPGEPDTPPADGAPNSRVKSPDWARCGGGLVGCWRGAAGATDAASTIGAADGGGSRRGSDGASEAAGEVGGVPRNRRVNSPAPLCAEAEGLDGAIGRGCETDAGPLGALAGATTGAPDGALDGALGDGPAAPP